MIICHSKRECDNIVKLVCNGYSHISNLYKYLLFYQMGHMNNLGTVWEQTDEDTNKRFFVLPSNPKDTVW